MNIHPRKMSFRSKLLLLAGIVLVSFVLALVMEFSLINEVRVGSRLYTTIKNNKDVLEKIALLQSDLNLFRAQVAIIIDETNADKAKQMRLRLAELKTAINDALAEIVGSTRSEEQSVSLEDARATWTEFLATTENDLLPAVQRGERLQARELASGIQEQRYNRYVEQIENTVTTLRLEVDELEQRTGEKVMRMIGYTAAAAGVAFLVILILAVMIGRSVVGPLMTLTRAAESFGLGEMNHQVAVTSEDEVGTLAKSFNAMIEKRRHVEAEREQLIVDLRDALKKVKTLSGLLPVCSSCKKVRDDKGYWSQIDAYISEHSDAEISHGLCPDCMKRLYPDYWEKVKKEGA